MVVLDTPTSWVARPGRCSLFALARLPETSLCFHSKDSDAEEGILMRTKDILKNRMTNRNSLKNRSMEEGKRASRIVRSERTLDA